MTNGQYRYLTHVAGQQPGGFHSRQSINDCFDLGFINGDGLTAFGRAEYEKAKKNPPAPLPVRSRQL